VLISIVVPTYNGRLRIKNTLDALFCQDFSGEIEIVVVDDGSTDGTADHVREYCDKIRVISQSNQGPAVARNLGAQIASGEIILFTDDDCIPQKDWLQQMLGPFTKDPDIVGVKGCYRTEQKSLVARFVQLEYEDKFDYMQKDEYIDFIDTYSAAFKRSVFLESGGYDTEFPVPCCEDAELSYRLSKSSYKMVFNRKAVVTHTHPDNLWWYLKKKFKFAYWRVVAVKKNPQKLIKDSHTPQIMKLQLLFPPICLASLLLGSLFPKMLSIAVLGFIFFGVSTVPFTRKALEKDNSVGLLSPLLLFCRACGQFVGVSGGVLYLLKKR
jgi:GT2 family glycosyltransferase